MGWRSAGRTRGERLPRVLLLSRCAAPRVRPSPSRPVSSLRPSHSHLASRNSPSGPSPWSASRPTRITASASASRAARMQVRISFQVLSLFCSLFSNDHWRVTMAEGVSTTADSEVSFAGPLIEGRGHLIWGPFVNWIFPSLAVQNCCFRRSVGFSSLGALYYRFFC